jgi:hypothetical protein
MYCGKINILDLERKNIKTKEIKNKYCNLRKHGSVSGNRSHISYFF